MLNSPGESVLWEKSQNFVKFRLHCRQQTGNVGLCNMLHRYTFRNFYSFADETTIDFRLPKTFHAPGASTPASTGVRMSNVMAAIGPNASGKTNLIKPLSFFCWFVSNSFRWEPQAEIPFETHFFSKDPNCEFEVELTAYGEIWRYHVILTRERVLHEALFRKTSKLFSYVFVRDWEKNNYTIRQQGFDMSPSEAKKVRPNASLIATAAQYNVPLGMRLSKLPFYTNVIETGRAHLGFDGLIEATRVFHENDHLRARMIELLHAWDLGLDEVKIEKVTFTDPTNTKTMDQPFPFGVHKHGKQTAKRIFLHESSGTQGAYLLLANLLPALNTGGLVVIDELEADLHPHMLMPILDLFLSENTNFRNAQIMFTCHAAEILTLLEKQQIMLVEKGEEGASEAWRLDSMGGVRKDDNLYAKYMAGAYGAVPQV
jgi:AAA15 family ATPase/GTPase